MIYILIYLNLLLDTVL